MTNDREFEQKSEAVPAHLAAWWEYTRSRARQYAEGLYREAVNLGVPEEEARKILTGNC